MADSRDPRKEAEKYAGKVNVPGSKIQFAQWDGSREAIRKNREQDVHDDLRPEIDVKGPGIKVGKAMGGR